MIRIALRGLGSAGRSRLKALKQTEGFELAGIASRRKDISTLELDAALSDSSIDAIAVSTENTLHASLTKRVLEAGKHALCDYPLAFSEREARDLMSLAASRGKILHAEHIGLLTDSHRAAHLEIRDREPLITGEYRFEGDWNPKLADTTRSGPLPFLACSRLLQVAEWFGDFDMKEANFGSGDSHFHLRLILRFHAGGDLIFIEERRPGLDRRRFMNAELKRGSYSWRPAPEPAGLFRRDLEHFHDRIADQIIGGAPPYYSEKLMLKVIKTLESIAPSR